MNTEVPARTQRRSFLPSYKLRILEEVDHNTAPGEIGALLRREGLYSSHLATWRDAKQKGALSGLSKKRGRKKSQSTVDAKEFERVVRENARLKKKLKHAEIVIDVQKKVSELLGVDLDQPESDENN